MPRKYQIAESRRKSFNLILNSLGHIHSQAARNAELELNLRIPHFDPGIDATLRRGLVPIIVPELKTITLGGAVSGCSIESARKSKEKEKRLKD